MRSGCGSCPDPVVGHASTAAIATVARHERRSVARTFDRTQGGIARLKRDCRRSPRRGSSPDARRSTVTSRCAVSQQASSGCGLTSCIPHKRIRHRTTIRPLNITHLATRNAVAFILAFPTMWDRRTASEARACARSRWWRFRPRGSDWARSSLGPSADAKSVSQRRLTGIGFIESGAILKRRQCARHRDGRQHLRPPPSVRERA